MKRKIKIIIVMLVAAIILAGSYAVLKAGLLSDGPEPQNSDSPYRFKLADSDLKEWKLVWEAKNLAEWPEDQRKSFITKNIDDAAGWRYEKGQETLEIWARNFASEDDLNKIEIGITNPIFWKAQSALAFADYAMVGIHVSEKPSPLLVYAAKNKTTFYINYYNKDGTYDAAQITKDKAFLVSLAKKILAKY